jgi:hypothetical protein
VCVETIDQHSLLKLCSSRSTARDHGVEPVGLFDTDTGKR